MKTKLHTLLFILLAAVISQANAQTNQYLHYDGVDDYTQLDNGAQYLTGSNTITMAGWFYSDNLVYGSGMMSIRGGGTGNGEMYVLQLGNGSAECRVITNTGLHEVVVPNGTFQAGVWQHVAWVFNETTVEIFIDGVSAGSASASGTFQSSNRPFTIGIALQPGFNFVWGGRADEVSLWNVALTQAQIQDMMANELVGDEAGLQVYYKFNQGTPGGNNTNISQLVAEGTNPSKNSDFYNLALTGETSNFNGTLEDGVQAINFPQVPNKLITDAPFELEASTNSGLEVIYEIVSGPATVAGSTVTLDGIAGTVTVKASQPGNDIWDAATDVFVTFEVLDPQDVVVEVDVLHPLEGNVFATSLTPIQVAVRASIDYPELFEVENVQVEIGGEAVTLTNHENGHFTGWWTPTSYGASTLEVTATNNYGVQDATDFDINILDEATDVITLATDEAWVNGDIFTVTQESDLPSHIGAYDEIIGTLQITCPPGGCDPWDRVSIVEAQGKDGTWYEIIRYLTPYGVACESEIDLTDFASILRGKTRFRVSLGTQGNGFEYTLSLNYRAGVPDQAYSSITKLWSQTYQFGDMANLQPTEQFNAQFPANTEAAKIKLVSSGHGWGANNTANAAEFLENTHHIHVNGQQTFEQNNWVDCNPNPDGCSPQNGTWQFDRAGWCPGSIAQFFDYDMSPYTTDETVALQYIFDESYTDFCHPNNPDCVTGQTCDNCNDGFNPHLIVNSFLISYGNAPMDNVALGNEGYQKQDFSLFPNPSAGLLYVDVGDNADISKIKVYDYLGREVLTQQVETTNQPIQVNLSNQSNGVYLVTIYEANRIVGTKKLIKE